MLKGHTFATLWLTILLCMWMMVKSTLELGLGGAALAVLMFVPIVAVIMLIIGLIALPYGICLQNIMRKAGYTGWEDYLYAGLTSGILMAILTQFFMVDVAPESNGYEEIFGTERACLFLSHYARGAIVGGIYALSYWYTIHYLPRKTAKTQVGQ